MASNEVAVLIEGFLTDISVTKTAGSGSVKQGAQLTYTITASNADPSSAENVTLTDSIPAALTGVEFSTDGGVTFNPWPGILGFGTMVSGKTQTILIRGTARPDAQGSISNTADVTSTPPDPIRTGHYYARMPGPCRCDGFGTVSMLENTLQAKLQSAASQLDDCFQIRI